MQNESHLSDTIRIIWIPLDKWGSHSKGTQSLHLNFSQWCSIVAMVANKAAFDTGEVERLVILVVILGAEVFIPVAGHILLEESYKVFEKFEAILSQFIAYQLLRHLTDEILHFGLRGTQEVQKQA